jgi:transposase
VEATFNWYWLVDGLQAEGFPVVLANPAAMQQYEGVKHTDDESDAFFVAELLRLGILPTGHICERKLRPFRDMLRRRLLLVRQRTSQLLSLKSLYARNTGQTLSQGGVKALELEEVPQLFSHPADQLIAGEQLKVMEQLNQGIRQIERAVEAVADPLPCYAGLQGLPGIGRILGLTITMETAGVERFPSPGDYAS